MLSFSCGGASRSTSAANGHPGIWPGRASSTVSSPSSGGSSGGALHTEDTSPPPPTDLFRNREGGGGMRVGKDFQARIPICCAHSKHKLVNMDIERALLVWCPTEKICDADINAYLKVASEKFTYTREQALGLLYWHNYDITKALEDLGNFTPHPEEWTIEDKIQFEQAFQFHGKAFDRIRQMLPDKSMSSIIRYYYKWKKTRNKSSAMDRHSKRISQMHAAEALSSASSSSAQTPSSSNNPNYSLNVISQRQPAAQLSESDDDITKKRKGGSRRSRCRNCGVSCTELCGEDKMCRTCYVYWKNTGNYRPLTGPLRRGDKQLLGLFRQNRTPPLGMYINHDDLTILASAPPQAKNIVVQGLEKDLLDSKHSIQSMKQKIDVLKNQLPATRNITELKPSKGESSSQAAPRLNARWTHEELLMAAQAVRLYGKDFSKIVEVIPTKSEAHVKSFYVNYRRRFGLDDLVKEQEMEVD